MTTGPTTSGKYINLAPDLVVVTKTGVQVDREKCFRHWDLYRTTPLAKGLNGFVFSVRATKATTTDEFVMKVQRFKENDGAPLTSGELADLNQARIDKHQSEVFTTNQRQLNRMKMRSAKSGLEVYTTARAANLGIAPELIDYWKCKSSDGTTELLFMVLRKVKNAETWADYKAKNKGVLSVALLDELACAIEKLHQNNIYHLDMHSNNILLEQLEDGVIVRLWIIDFGFTASDKDPLMDYDQLDLRDSYDRQIASKEIPPRENTDFGAMRKQLYLKNKSAGIETLHQLYLDRLMSM